MQRPIRDTATIPLIILGTHINIASVFLFFRQEARGGEKGKYPPEEGDGALAGMARSAFWRRGPTKPPSGTAEGAALYPLLAKSW